MSETSHGESTEIVPLRIYTVDEARVLLRPGKPLSRDALYRMGSRKLIRTVRLGPRGGLTGFPGWALIEFIRGERRAA